jgi:hypothetical protein
MGLLRPGRAAEKSGCVRVCGGGGGQTRAVRTPTGHPLRQKQTMQVHSWIPLRRLNGVEGALILGRSQADFPTISNFLPADAFMLVSQVRLTSKGASRGELWQESQRGTGAGD